MSVAVKVTDETIEAQKKPARLHVVCVKEDLELALAHVTKAVKRTATIPVIANVLLATGEHGFFISGTNLEVGVRRRVHIHNMLTEDEYASVTIPAHRLLEFVKALNKGDTVTITQTAENAIKVAAEKSRTRATMTGLPSAEYPHIPTRASTIIQAEQRAKEAHKATCARLLKENATAELPPYVAPQPLAFAMTAKHLLNIDAMVGIAAAKDDARPVFTGILFRVTDNKVVTAAADSFRLATYEADDVELLPDTDYPDMLVPATSIAIAADILAKDPSALVRFTTTPNVQQVIMEVGTDITIVSNLLNGAFPNYAVIFPDNHTSRLTVVRQELGTAFRRAMMFSKNAASNLCIVKVRDGLVTVIGVDEDLGDTEQDVTPTAISYAPHYQGWTETRTQESYDETGEAVEKDVEIRFDGDPEEMPETEFIVNGMYVRQFLAAMTTGQVTLAFRKGGNPRLSLMQNMGPISFTPVPDTDTPLPYSYQYLAMPMSGTSKDVRK